MATEHILHMKKSLSQMNLVIQRGLSDITGASGQPIVDAILAGERDLDPITFHTACSSRKFSISGREYPSSVRSVSTWAPKCGIGSNRGSAPEGIAGGSKTGICPA